MKVEIFRENIVSMLQRVINEWFEKHPDIEINRVKQSEDERGITISIFYREKQPT